MKVEKSRLVSIVVLLCLTFALFPTPVIGVEQDQFLLADNYVVIEYVKYNIVNSKITYNGKEFEKQGFVFISYDNDETEVMVLPIEQNRITDPDIVFALNARIGLIDVNANEVVMTDYELNEAINRYFGNSTQRSAISDYQSGSKTRAIPANPVSLPYSSSVPSGQYSEITPAFTIPERDSSNKWYGVVHLTLSNFSPSGADKRFNIIFTYCDQLGNWYTYNPGGTEQNFGNTSTMKFTRLSLAAYGMFALTNLYGNPSPAYNYSISVSVA